jgi:hypothetical protein
MRQLGRVAPPGGWVRPIVRCGGHGCRGATPRKYYVAYFGLFVGVINGSSVKANK